MSFATMRLRLLQPWSKDVAMLLLRSVAERHRQPEIMDLPDLAVKRHFHALRGLERINRWSGSARLLWRPIFARLQNAPHEPWSMLDVATGGGDIPVQLWQK